MKPFTSVDANNLFYIEDIYADYLRDPSSVDESWRQAFDSSDSSLPPGSPAQVPPPAPEQPRSDSVSMLSPTVIRNLEEPMPGDLEARTKFLAALPMYSKLAREEVEAVAWVAEEIDAPAGTQLCVAGEPGADLYIITDGRVVVERGGRVIAELGRGGVVGELAVLDQKPRSADVLAYTDAHLLRIDGESFLRLLETRPSFSKGLLQVLASRLRNSGARQARVQQLARAFRVRGHVRAQLDPIGLRAEHDHPELTLEQHGLSEKDLDRVFNIRLGAEHGVFSLRHIIETMEKTYTGAIGVQYMHIDDLKVQGWLQERLESQVYRRELPRADQLRILKKLTDAEIFETFLHRKFLGAKRFSLEGGESLIPLLDLAVEKGGDQGIDEIVIGMAHRGRLNVLANILNKPAWMIFREFEDADHELQIGSGDVKYHLGYSSDIVTSTGHKVHMSLSFNPSHLECVGPVVLGRTRAKQDRFGDRGERSMAILLHGDAAFCGEGVVQELFNLSELPAYTTGGTIHIVVNNQVGFTTSPEESRSTMYCTDVAKMLQIPIFHVNGEDAEAVARVIDLAMDFRQTFHKDIVIDMYCYRKHGHNEGDDPSYTQPQMYEVIKKHETVRQAYVRNLLRLGGITQEEADEIAKRSRERLEHDLARARSGEVPKALSPALQVGQGIWTGYLGGPGAAIEEANTAVPKERLISLLEKLTAVPESFAPYRKIKRFLDKRLDMAKGEVPLDWGAGEALAFASLVTQGARIRLTGQDTQRGTFSHRHAVFHDPSNGTTFCPLQHLSDDQAPFDVFNSPLTETGTLGYEYGYSLDTPDGLVIWEAQFGDFVNVAQVIIDQFITSGEDKWRRFSGLVMLLPHGFEGQGPEHSSARLERFLTMAAEDNIQVCNPTSPAQLFHLLRRQVIRPWRKPLVVMTPKSLLRLPAAVSQLDELSSGRFQCVIPDTGIDPIFVRRVLVCSGKVYYDLVVERERLERRDVALVRLEQLYPTPIEELERELARYPRSATLHWVQEEPLNMGAWPYMRLHYGHDGAIGGRTLKGVSRPESASPATGSHEAHNLEQKRLMHEAFES